MANWFTRNQSFEDPESIKLYQRAQYAEALRDRAQKPLEATTAGRVVVPPSWTQGLAQLVTALGARKAEHQLFADAKAMDQEKGKAYADGLLQFRRTGDPSALLENRQTRDLGAQLMVEDARAQRQQKTTLSPQEITQVGLPAGTIAQRDASGGLAVVSKPEAAPARIQEYRMTHPDDSALAGYDQWVRDNRAAGANRINVMPEMKGNQKAMELGVARIYDQTDKAQSAAEGIGAVHMARQGLDNGAFVGPGGDTKQGVSKFLQMMGVNVAPEAVAATDQFRSGVGQLVLSQIKSLGANPSNADREQLERIVGSLPTDPNAMRSLLDWREQQLRKTIDTHNRAIGSAQQSGINFPYPLNVDAPPAYRTPTTKPQSLNNDEWGEYQRLKQKYGR